MSNLMELRQAAEYDAQNKMQSNPLYGLVNGLGVGFNAGIEEEMKRQKDEKRRVENIKNQMSNFQQMMQTMNSMPDNSTSARGVGLLDDNKNKDRKGITGISTMVPQREMSIDETGAVNIKIGTRVATPQEQKAQFDIQKSQMEQEKANAKSQLLDGYIRGDIQEGAILKEMGSLGITPDEFDMAAQARSRFRQVAQMQTSSMQQNQQQMPTEQPIRQELSQPQEQQFMFDKSKALQEKKLTGEIQAAEEAKQNKSQAVIDSSNKLIETVDHLLKNKNYFGPLEGSIAPVFPGKIEFDQNYKYLQANNVMKVLGEMKSQSRTGATGFGALNEKELALIQDAASKLNVRMDEKTAEKYLIQMRDSFQKIKDREQNGYEGERGGKFIPQAGQVDNNDPLGIR